MYTETVDFEDAGLSIAGNQIGAVQIAAVCGYLTGEKGFAEFQSVHRLLLSVPGQNLPVVIEVGALPQDQIDAIEEVVQPLFEAWMDDAGDVSPADYDPAKLV